VTAFLPFSAASKEWEPVALELRKLAGVKRNDRLCPFALAPKVGLRVVDATEWIKKLSPAHRSHLTGDGRSRWSGGVLPKPLSDGTFLCMVNPFHGERRNRITLMEEIVHVFRGHSPTQVLRSGDGVSVRDYIAANEREAYGIGAAALIPWSEFFPAVNRGKCTDELAESFDVTTELILYRIKITGAYRLYKSRQARSA
jgi:uncharacterized protein DUF955